ncbi:MFS transporter [Derxia gummosa]|uniref:MFS transporter n=1 Tax=Derxia gummosa DSM 723 TaxID=1121388 RepID=A0A8B6X924_9BURK|nr:MFS transporter [Derxia gummosa]
MTSPTATASAPAAGATPPATDAAHWTEPGSAAYRHIVAALFLAGYSTFSLLHCVQPLLPAFADSFAVSPAVASLALSMSTGALAWAILLVGAFSERWSRKRTMTVSMFGAAALTLVAALAPGWHGLLAARMAVGIVLGGVPAVAMAYLAEEIHPRGLGFAMGLYVSGTSIGGMTGRVITGLAAEAWGWRAALGLTGLLGLLAAAGFVALLPASRNFRPRPPTGPGFHLKAWGAHLATPGLAPLYAIGLLVMGSFMAVYNYAGFRLMAPPYSLNQAHIGLIFLLYLTGTVASSAAGWLADRLGRGPVMIGAVLITLAGAGLTLLVPLAGFVAGIGVLTFGFFAVHALASGWVGRLARGNKGHASALYLLAYYLGASVMGSTGGWFWMHAGWAGVTGFVAAQLLPCLACALLLHAMAKRAAKAG